MYRKSGFSCFSLTAQAWLSECQENGEAVSLPSQHLLYACFSDLLNSTDLGFLIFISILLQTPRETPAVSQLPYAGKRSTAGGNDTTLVGSPCPWMAGVFLVVILL